MKHDAKEGFFSKATVSRLYLLAAMLALVLTLQTCSPRACAWFDFARAQVEGSSAYQKVSSMAEALRAGDSAVQVLGRSLKKSSIEEN